MTLVKHIAGRFQRWHERTAGHLMMAMANGVSLEQGCRAGYGLRLRAVMGGRIILNRDVRLDRWVDLFAHVGVLELGAGCYIGKGCVIVARETITIGSGCQIAERVTIRDQDHLVVPGIPIAESGFETAPVTIGANVWIGAGATVTRGVTIGDGAVIGAGAVVTRDISAGAKAVGVPAREYENDFKNHKILETL